MNNITVKTMARAVGMRTDNGPGWSRAASEIQPVEIAGGRLIFPQNRGLFGRRPVSLAGINDPSSGRAEVGEIVQFVGELPEPPPPGLAFPGASKHNAPLPGSGLTLSFGDWRHVEITIEFFPDRQWLFTLPKDNWNLP